MTTMKAVRLHEFGGPEVLKYEEAPRPEPGAGEILLEVRAIGVNPVDWKIREGEMEGMMKHTLPLILGIDAAGVVAAVGPGVTEFAPGDEVFAMLDMTRDGSYAEYAVVKTETVAAKPASVDFVNAAALPGVGVSAWQCLFDIADLQAGQTVLIHGASGGVGSMAVQLAHWKGARVIGTASAQNKEFLEKLGADEVIDYHATRFEDVVSGVDMVLDTQGGDTQERSWGVLKPGGILVTTVPPPPGDAAKAHSVRGEFLFAQPNTAVLTQLANLVASGDLTPVIATTLPLAEARRAQELSATGHTRGKIVLTV